MKEFLSARLKSSYWRIFVDLKLGVTGEAETSDKK